MGWFLFFSVVIIAIVIWVLKTNTITEYYDSGIVKLSGKTRFGKRDGEFKYYDKNGFCYCYQKYEKGKLVSTNYLLKYAQEEIKSNKEIILQAVKSSGLNIEYASESLKNDREIVMAAVQNNGRSLNYVLKEFGSDREVVLEAVRNVASIIEHLSYQMRNDREIVMQAVKIYGYLLKFASAEMKNDREIVMEAIRNNHSYYKNGSFLEFASSEMRNDREIVLEAIKNNDNPLRDGRSVLLFVSTEMRNDREIALFSVNCNYVHFRYLNDNFQRDIQIIQQAVNSCKKSGAGGGVFGLLPQYLRRDRELISSHLKHSDILELDGSFFKKYNRLKNHENFIEKTSIIITMISLILIFVLKLLKMDTKMIEGVFWVSAINLFLGIIVFMWFFSLMRKMIFKRVKIIHIDNLKEYLIKEEFWAIQYATEEIRLNQKLILDTISQSRKLEILAYVDQALKIDLEFNKHLKPFITELLLAGNKNSVPILDFYHYWFLGNQHLVNDPEIAKLMNEKRPV